MSCDRSPLIYSLPIVNYTTTQTSSRDYKQKQRESLLCGGILSVNVAFKVLRWNKFIMYIVVIDGSDCPRMTLFGILSKIDGTVSI